MGTTAVEVAFAVLVALGLSAALTDRLLAALAERRAAAALAAAFGSLPTVRFHGLPFLTQALRGRYREVDVTGAGLRLGELTAETAHVRLANAYLSARDLRGGRVAELPCEHLAARLVLAYPELARLSRVPGLSLQFTGGHLVATAALPVPGLGQLARVSGRADLALEGGAVRLRVSDLSVAGISLTALVIRQLVPRMNVPIPLPPLPWGLRLDDLVPREGGLVVVASAAAVVLRPVVRPEDWDHRPVA